MPSFARFSGTESKQRFRAFDSTTCGNCDAKDVRITKRAQANPKSTKLRCYCSMIYVILPHLNAVCTGQDDFASKVVEVDPEEDPALKNSSKLCSFRIQRLHVGTRCLEEPPELPEHISSKLLCPSTSPHFPEA